MQKFTRRRPEYERVGEVTLAKFLKNLQRGDRLCRLPCGKPMAFRPGLIPSGLRLRTWRRSLRTL